MKLIPVGKDAFALVDDEDFEAVSALAWHLTESGYAVWRGREHGRKKTLRMHRLILGDVKGDVDHIDGNKLNNQRSNLRPATRTQNNGNCRPRSGCSSRYKGVAWVRNYGKWWAYINLNGKRKNLGYFDDEMDAARAYNAAAIQVFGEFARPNSI